MLKQLAKIDTLIIDDWGLAVLDDVHRRDLLEVFDDRHGVRSTIVTSQIPIEHWHAASVTRPWLTRSSTPGPQRHHLNLKGESMRKKRAGLTSTHQQE
nr:ATP-binding protein [Massilia cavernae]